MESKNTCVEVFGKRLKELRKANGYTIEQFADMVGISKSKRLNNGRAEKKIFSFSLARDFPRYPVPLRVPLLSAR